MIKAEEVVLSFLYEGHIEEAHVDLSARQGRGKKVIHDSRC
jgi:hypothetical protein